MLIGKGFNALSTGVLYVRSGYYLSFGLNYEDNFENKTDFNLAASLRMTELNALGAEYRRGAVLHRL